MKLNFVVPDRNTKGYLRRQQRALEFSQKMKDKTADPTMFHELALFLAPMLVVDGTDDNAAAEFLMDELTQDQFDQMLNALTGGGVNPIPPPNGADSSSTTSPE